jgi:hypothetical protein
LHGRRRPVIAKPEGHDINSAGKRLLRKALEPLGWVVKVVEEHYGIDFNVQVSMENVVSCPVEKLCLFGLFR